MKTEVKEKLIKALAQENIKQIMKSSDFYFQKAVDKYNEMMSLPKLSEEVTERLVKRVEELRDTNSFSHQSLLKEFDDKLPELELIYKIGELVAYIDSHGYNKKEYNKYEDNRTIATTFVRQYAWVINLLKYKLSENVEALPGVIKNTIRYLITPKSVINVLSEKHRKLIGMFIFQNSSIALNFDEIAAREMEVLKVEVENEENRLLVYEKILYTEDIKKIWDYSQTIWKLSHGKIQSFADGKRKIFKRKNNNCS